MTRVHLVCPLGNWHEMLARSANGLACHNTGPLAVVSHVRFCLGFPIYKIMGLPEFRVHALNGSQGSSK